MSSKKSASDQGKISLAVVGVLVLAAIAIPVSLKLVSNQQDIRQHAAGNYESKILADSRTRAIDDCVGLETISPFCEDDCGGNRGFKLTAWHEPGEEPVGWFGLSGDFGLPLFDSHQKDDCRKPWSNSECATRSEMLQVGLGQCESYPNDGPDPASTPTTAPNPGGCIRGDADGDGDVDYSDFSVWRSVKYD